MYQASESRVAIVHSVFTSQADGVVFQNSLTMVSSNMLFFSGVAALLLIHFTIDGGLGGVTSSLSSIICSGVVFVAIQLLEYSHLF